MISILELITPRVEDALNVDSLTLGEHVDRFRLPAYIAPTFPSLNPPTPTLILRLTNGFVVPDTLQMFDAEGIEIDFTAEDDIDLHKGIITLENWNKGVITVSYISGFEPITPSPLPTPYDECQRVLENIPLWLKAIVVDCLVQWYRVEHLSPRLTKEMDTNFVSSSLQRIITTRIYSRYQRPRQQVIWGEARDS